MMNPCNSRGRSRSDGGEINDDDDDANKVMRGKLWMRRLVDTIKP